MQPYYEAKGVTLFQGDCLEVMRYIPDASIDACITDPPYGTTACSWDAVIPFAPMWAELKRIVKKNGAIVLFGSQPFTSALVMSNPQMFRYQWVWNKLNGGNPFTVKARPIIQTEDIPVFSADGAWYFPQLDRENLKNVLPEGVPRTETSEHFGEYAWNNKRNVGYPRNLLEFCDAPRNKIHPTQKPVELLRYLVRTYTNEGDTVLDFTCGSGTTGVACVIERREFIGIDSGKHWCEVSEARIKRAQGIACDIPKRIKQYAPTPLFEAVA